MSKIDDNKQHKFDALCNSAYELFLEKGIKNTSVSDIVNHAGMAKGTFYLYFKDKYQIRDYLIAKISTDIFKKAIDQLDSQKIDIFEDKIVFVVNEVIEFMKKNKPILRLVSKDLSWGMFHRVVSLKQNEKSGSLEDWCISLLRDEHVKLRNPENMLFMIVELAGSVSCNTILDNDPMPFEDLKEDLYQNIRAIVRSHEVITA